MAMIFSNRASSCDTSVLMRSGWGERELSLEPDEEKERYGSDVLCSAFADGCESILRVISLWFLGCDVDGGWRQ